MVARSTYVIPPIWLMLWAILLSLCWLLPNHFRPWTSFHADAWLALIALIGALATVWRVWPPLQWRVLPIIAGTLVALPWFHFAAGLLPFAGQSWMSSAYLLGFLLALLIGARWESASPRQLELALFLAIGLAAIVSVWLQFYTWLGLWAGGITDIWSMGLSGDRPYANLGQPNNLATLLLWGLLACFWAYQQGFLGNASTLLLAAFLLPGLALTQSRTGLLSLTVVLLAIWLWRRLWPSRRLPWVSTGLYLFYWMCPWLLQCLHTALQLGQDNALLRLQQQGELRLGAWRLFAQAVLERPWFGYGWTELGSAQTAVAVQFPSLGVTFGHSHNLFLDLALWNGLPIGLAASGFLIWWFWKKFRAIRQAEDAILFMVLVMVGIHAMLELPLHYAYFLLPTGLIMGILDLRLGAQVVWTSPRWTLGALWLIAALVLGAIIRDYFRVEESYNALRFEQARIGIDKTPTGSPPQVLVLTQLRELIRAGRFEVHAEMTPAELEWLEVITRTFPSAGNAYRMATALALNNRPEEALAWLQVICKISDARECQQVRRAWVQDSIRDARTAAIQWPDQ